MSYPIEREVIERTPDGGERWRLETPHGMVHGELSKLPNGKWCSRRWFPASNGHEITNNVELIEAFPEHASFIRGVDHYYDEQGNIRIAWKPVIGFAGERQIELTQTKI